MSTAYVYNGFGAYDDNPNGDGEKGVTLKYAGVEFFFPFQKVTPIPDWTMREVDHAASTPDGESEGVLSYTNFMLSGKRIAEELLETQLPYKNREKGIIEIQGKPTGQMVEVPAGVSTMGELLTVEVAEREPLKKEIEEAAKLAADFKAQLIQDYFQSKRERMAGGKGQLHPLGAVKVFMAELGVKDIDDIERHQNAGGLSVELVRAIMEEARRSNEINAQKLIEAVETARKHSRAVSSKPASKSRFDGIEKVEDGETEPVASN